MQLKESLRKAGSPFSAAAYGKGKNRTDVSLKDNPCGYAHRNPSTHSWVESDENPANSGQKERCNAEYERKKKSKPKHGGPANTNVAGLEAQLATQKALVQILQEKKNLNTRQPDASNANAAI